MEGRGVMTLKKALPAPVFPRVACGCASDVLADNGFSPAAGKEPASKAQNSSTVGSSPCPSPGDVLRAPT